MKKWVVWDTHKHESVSYSVTDYNEAATICLNMCNRFNNHGRYVVRELIKYCVLVDCDSTKEHIYYVADLKELKLHVHAWFNTEFFFEDGLIVNADSKDVIGTYEEMKL